jgi:threonine aldolase
VSAGARGFGSDNHSGVHPEVLAAITAANEGHVPAYGDDELTARAHSALRDHFGAEARPFLVFNGTAANVLALTAMSHGHGGVICPDTAHMHVDECGAPERIAGLKLLPVPTPDGKLTPELAEARIERVGDPHAVQPRVISISESTELGTVYTAAEVAELAELAHRHGMLLHMDGARLANAAVARGGSLADLTTESGVDALSLGGTKNGLLVGDAVVFLRPELAEGFEFVRKQLLQLASKMRFLAAQFVALMEGDLWHRNAAHANEMAHGLARALEAIDGVALAQPTQANGVFANLPAAAIERLQAELPGEHPFYVWDEAAGTVRLMCAWDTQPEDVDALVAALGRAIAV